jgi:alkanesulfonate monooxygenase SsuD/methylene tetrahydromethanopterin reductase-like flavin-dependent oxidoreductase (luciferase family)
MDRLDESLGVIKALWTESRPWRSGNYYSLDRPPYNPPNVQQPHPPVLIGGGGEKRTLRIVAKYADVANVQGTPEEVAHKWRVLDEHCKAVGREPKEIKRTIQAPLWLTDDQAFKERVAQGMAAAGARDTRSALLGNADEVKEQVQAFKEAGVEEIYLAQWPRTHMESLRGFSEKVIPEFV